MGNRHNNGIDNNINTRMNTDGCKECPFFKTQRNFLRRGKDCSYYEGAISEASKYDCGMRISDTGSLDLRAKLKNHDRRIFWLIVILALPLAFMRMYIGGFLLPLAIALIGHGFVLPGIRKIRAKKRM